MKKVACVIHDELTGLRGGDGVMSKRQVIQSSRLVTVREIWRVMDKRIVPAR